MPWIRHRLREADVWARVDIHGAPIKDPEGRVEIVYKPVTGAKVYRAGARNLTVVPNSEPIEIAVGDPAPDPKRRNVVPSNAIHVWTDGGCVPNPGPCGIGVVIVDGEQRIELSEYLGEGTNNIAELTAIIRGLEEVTDKARPIIVYSDSLYAINLLSQGWKAKKNVELVQQLRELMKLFSEVRFVKVAAHTGIALNERVDQLASSAIQRRR